MANGWPRTQAAEGGAEHAMNDLRIPAAPGIGDPPSPESLFDVVSGRGESAKRLEIESHVAVCSECSAELAHIKSFQAPQTMSRSAREAAWRRFATPTPAAARRATPNSPGARFPVWAFAGAAAALLAGIALTLLLRTPATQQEVERGAPGATALVSPHGPLPGPPREFKFRNPSGRLTRVAVFDAARSFDWTSEPTTAESVTLPPDQRAQLVAGREYFWTLVGTGSPAPAISFRIEGIEKSR